MKYEIRNAAGHSCCKTDTFAHLCDHCAAKVRAADPYGPGIAALRAAQGITAHDNSARLTAMSAFRQSVTDMAITSRAAAHRPVRTDAHLTPPNPYKLALERRAAR